MTKKNFGYFTSIYDFWSFDGRAEHQITPNEMTIIVTLKNRLKKNNVKWWAFSVIWRIEKWPLFSHIKLHKKSTSDDLFLVIWWTKKWWWFRITNLAAQLTDPHNFFLNTRQSIPGFHRAASLRTLFILYCIYTGGRSGEREIEKLWIK